MKTLYVIVDLIQHLKYTNPWLKRQGVPPLPWGVFVEDIEDNPPHDNQRRRTVVTIISIINLFLNQTHYKAIRIVSQPETPDRLLYKRCLIISVESKTVSFLWYVIHIFISKHYKLSIKPYLHVKYDYPSMASPSSVESV